MFPTRHLRAAFAIALIGAAGACSDTTATAPAPAADNPHGVPGTTSTSFPALTKPGSIYNELASPYGDPSTQQYHGGSLASQLVLYADSTFGLRFQSARFGFFEYRG